ncbi:putative leucine-rich repeat-containing protein DDB_G0290503 [Hylaeus volcanicus]|uniref:putative leucine-rich repeat-containing protein DDB_G0290503 n=1 Tax=Hylaeus volcanicus TaxID=313075 RepID=UPI0023B7C7FF|nr:putative leucine-rich repeat-containing protein DDB_G0290503 [Hylaeus volcanicus]XP_053985956.1 putative leucine-rich repeat-containing protein DDB_G0290503 [Hylaeus volcanicus]
MPGCAAVGCNNRSEKGYIMKCFPRDPKLRKIWQERVARADWEPSNNSFLCHVHFEPQEWSITQSGRIRLRKNAIPSIFTITSTRKSPKKRTRIIGIKEENSSQNEYSTEYVENSTKHSSTEYLEEKDSDFQDLCEPFIQFVGNKFRYVRKYVGEDDEKESVNSDLQEESIIMIAEDNVIDISGSAKYDNLEARLNNSKKETGLSLMIDNPEAILSSAIVKEEIKLEVMDHNAFEDSYDEIEEKLKQICDGGSTEDESYNNEGRRKLTIKSRKQGVQMIDRNGDINNGKCKVALSVNTNHNFPGRNEFGHTLMDKEENVEIIFGIESGDEKISVSQITSKINKVDDNALRYDEIISIKDEKKIFNEDIEENFTKDEVHVIPNIRAAMKRKRRTREEIMKSIKKSIRSTSDQDVNSSTNNDLSDSIEQETTIKDELSMFSREMSDINKRNNSKMEVAKFVIKVTGDPDDVTEIIEELSTNTIETQVSQKFTPVCKNEENNAFITSVITVLSPKNQREITYSDFSSPLTRDDYATSTKKDLYCSPSKDREFVNLDFTHNSKNCRSSSLRRTCSDEENKNQTKTNSVLQNSMYTAQTTIENNTKCSVSPDYEDLLERIQIQEDVIGKLTDQLIIYKELENSLRNKDVGHDVQIREVETTPKIYTRSNNSQALAVTKKILESKQRLIEDLSNRVNYFEEMNKKLMKTVTLESQQKRKLEGQIKQKDNRIKELNWKLEKASKYLERAEKNTNTYRRKMLNMQTIMRRRKLLDEKMNKFNEILIDSSRQEFSEKALAMAADIRKTCGRNGYDKLLSYGIPLPPLPALCKGVFKEDYTDNNKSDTDKVQNSISKLNIKTEKMQDTNNESETDEKDSELPDAIAKTCEYDGAETVTGTVQDIFDENNDGDDFSTNELREHFILQLNAVM